MRRGFLWSHFIERPAGPAEKPVGNGVWAPLRGDSSVLRELAPPQSLLRGWPATGATCSQCASGLPHMPVWFIRSHRDGPGTDRDLSTCGRGECPCARLGGESVPGAPGSRLSPAGKVGLRDHIQVGSGVSPPSQHWPLPRRTSSTLRPPQSAQEQQVSIAPQREPSHCICK